MNNIITALERSRETLIEVSDRAFACNERWAVDLIKKVIYNNE